MSSRRPLKELLIALALLAFGLICLPALVYVVGQRLLGDYEAGIAGFYEATANALAGGNTYVWILVLSPYFTIQLVRLGLWIRRQRPHVN
jgi:hypothetical protein